MAWLAGLLTKTYLSFVLTFVPTYLMRNIFLGCLLSGFRKTTERENLMLWMCVTSAANKMQEVLKEIDLCR